MALRTVGVRLTADVQDYQRKLRSAGQSTKDFVGEMDKASKAGRLDAVADSVGAVGLGLVGMAGYAVNASMKFEKSMSGVQAATHASAKEVDMLRQAALKAGKDTQYSATEAADGVTELAKAGVSTADILNGGLDGALDLAAAGQLDVAEAAELSASAMTQFKLSGKDLPHVADLLAAAAGKAQGSVHDMGQALNQAGLVAAQTGLSIEETTGGLAAFASAGLTGSDAGTSFKQMLLMIQAPSDKSKNLMEELGISLYDASGQFVGLTKFADRLRVGLKDLTPEARAAALAQIFGADATRAASIVYEQGAEGIQQWIDKVNDSGYAQETAAILTDNLAGDIERLKGSVETLAIEAGSASNGGLRTLVQVIEKIVDGVGSLPPFVTNAATILAGAAGAAALLAAGWVKARRATTAFRTELESIGPGGEKASRGLQKVTAVAGKASLVFAGLQVAGALINQMQKDLNPQVEAMAAGLQKYAAGGELAGESSRVLGKNLEDLKVGFAFLADEDNNRRQAVKHMQDGLEGLIPGLDGTNTSLTKTRERITAMDAALAQLAQGGNAGQANEIFQKLASDLATGGVSMEEFRKQFPQYAAALEVAGNATGDAATKTDGLGKSLEGTADKQKEFTSATDAAAAAAKGQRDALSQLSDFMKAQLNPVIGWIEAQKTLSKAQREATQAQKDLDKAIDKHGPKSKEARAATDKLNDATRTLASSAVDLQGKAGELGQSFDGKMTPALRNTLKAAHLTDAQIRILEQQFKNAKKAADQYDGQYVAKASAPGAVDSARKMADAWAQAKGFAGSYNAKVSISGDKPVGQRLNRLAELQKALKEGKNISTSNKKNIGYAAGGWTGPGDTYDPVGVVHADEHVIRKSSRRRLEAEKPGALDYMNRTGEWPGYAGGGRAWPYRVNAAKTRVPPWGEVASAVTPDFGRWPSSPGAQRGDSGVWRKILALVRASGIPYDFGNAYRAGDPLWHGSGRAIDFMGYNQDRLAKFFLARQGQVLELIHRSKNRDYGVTRGHYNAMPHQWPLHRNHLHIAMKDGGTIREPVYGIGASGRTYSFGENYQPERVVPNWQGGGAGGSGATQLTVVIENHGVIGSRQEVDNMLTGAIDRLRARGRI